MNDLSPQNSDLSHVSALAWVVGNKFQNENNDPIEFSNHRFLIDAYADEHDDIVVKKSAQVGWSVAAILRSFWDTGYGGWNVIYALPTNNVVQDFVKPKVNPLIGNNPAISKMVQDDSVSYKRINGRNLFFKGGFSDRDAISITGDILVVDEYDRMPDMSVVNTFDSRLQASKHPKRRRFSNPSNIGFGVDALYQDSDQMHWFIKCHHCGHEWFIDFETDGKCHYVHQKQLIYACGKCHEELSDTDRRNGRWVARFKGRKRRGYWISQMMAPWVSAARIMEQKEESSVDFFYNFVLGKAYTPSDLVVNRETILRATAPSTIAKTQVAIGVDQNVSEQIWVAMTPQGVFAHGKVKSWEEIERLKLMWNAVIVSDPAPYPTMPKRMAEKYHDWYLCYFKESKSLKIVEWKGHIVYADRTRLLDTVANEITEARLLFRERPQELEDYIADWQNIYRTTKEEPDGRVKSVWMKKENRESDYSFATAYARIGLSRMLGGGMDLIEPTNESSSPIAYSTSKDGTSQTSLGNIVEESIQARLDDGEWL